MKKVLRIAVADRSVLCRKIAKKLLTKMCHSVFATDNADSLIAVIKQSLILATHDHSNLFDVILLASNLNGTCDAYQTCQYIRQLGFKGILCALTALPTSALSHFIDCGATNVLLKPLMKEQFICLCKGTLPKLPVATQIQPPTSEHISTAEHDHEHDKNQHGDHHCKHAHFHDMEERDKFMSKSLRILLLDDVNGSRRAVHALLAHLGHIVTETGTVASALKTITNSLVAVKFSDPSVGYDVVMLSTHMLDINPIEAIDDIRAVGFTKIILSVVNNSNPIERDHLLAGGSDETLVNPVTSDKFRTTIRRVCQSHPQHKAVVHPLGVAAQPDYLSPEEERKRYQKFSHLRVMVMDPNVESRKVVWKALCREGCAVVESTSPDETVKTLKNSVFEVAKAQVRMQSAAAPKVVEAFVGTLDIERSISRSLGFDIVVLIGSSSQLHNNSFHRRHPNLNHNIDKKIAASKNSIDSQEVELEQAVQSVENIRRTGYTGFLLAVTDQWRPSHRAKLKTHGASEVVQYPLTMLKFEEAIVELLQDETSNVTMTASNASLHVGVGKQSKQGDSDHSNITTSITTNNNSSNISSNISIQSSSMESNVHRDSRKRGQVGESDDKNVANRNKNTPSPERLPIRLKDTSSPTKIAAAKSSDVSGSQSTRPTHHTNGQGFNGVAHTKPSRSRAHKGSLLADDSVLGRGEGGGGGGAGDGGGGGGGVPVWLRRENLDFASVSASPSSDDRANEDKVAAIFVQHEMQADQSELDQDVRIDQIDQRKIQNTEQTQQKNEETFHIVLKKKKSGRRRLECDNDSKILSSVSSDGQLSQRTQESSFSQHRHDNRRDRIMQLLDPSSRAAAAPIVSLHDQLQAAKYNCNSDNRSNINRVSKGGVNSHSVMRKQFQVQPLDQVPSGQYSAQEGLSTQLVDAARNQSQKLARSSTSAMNSLGRCEVLPRWGFTGQSQALLAPLPPPTSHMMELTTARPTLDIGSESKHRLDEFWAAANPSGGIANVANGKSSNSQIVGDQSDMASRGTKENGSDSRGMGGHSLLTPTSSSSSSSSYSSSSFPIPQDSAAAALQRENQHSGGGFSTRWLAPLPTSSITPLAVTSASRPQQREYISSALLRTPDLRPRLQPLSESQMIQEFRAIDNKMDNYFHQLTLQQTQQRLRAEKVPSESKLGRLEEE